MSNNDDQPPQWAHTLLERITGLEQSILNNNPQASSPLVDDPNVLLRAPGSDLTPPQEIVDKFPFMTLDFFRRPLPDEDRRRFLFECPKNTLRNYTPPDALRVSLPNQAKTTDAQLHDIQYRLSGLTRPIDWHVYKLLSQPSQDASAIQGQSLEFAQAIHELLSDVASYITELRINNLYKAANIHCKPPSVHQQDNSLIDPKAFVDHLNLNKGIQQAISKNRPRSNMGKKSSTSINNNSNNKASTPNVSSSSPDKAKPYDKRPPPSTNADFHQSQFNKKKQ